MATATTVTHMDDSVTQYVAKPRKMLINGKWVESASGKTFPSYNPATADVLAQVAEGDVEDINRAVAAARAAFDKGPWSKMSASQRGRIIWKVGDLIEKYGEELAQLESLDNGKPLKIARIADIPLAAELFRYMAGWATKIEGNTIPITGAPNNKFLDVQLAGASRRGWADYSLELPAADGRVETRAGAGGGLHGRVETSGAN